MKAWWGGTAGIRGKLILIFVVIKVVPLLLLAWVAWSAAQGLSVSISGRATTMAEGMLGSIRQVGEQVTGDAIAALDDRSREAIERLTTDTAQSVATFLYDRDADILQAAQIDASEAAYAGFLRHRQRALHEHGPWQLSADGMRWQAATPQQPDSTAVADARQALPDNARNFSARPPEYLGQRVMRPLFAEMSFIDTQGQERVKLRNVEWMPAGLRDVSQSANTFVRAEHYWPALKKLKPGEIYVSEVIGAYVGSKLIGMYTPEAAKKAGIPYEPTKSAYAGTENPLGQRYHGIVRWATPVVRNGVVAGYVTLALDHAHLRQFTDHVMPTAQRYTPIIDAIEGNYAFMWDHKSRAIVHPRDYFIVGYDPANGQPVTPWLDQQLYEEWQASGKASPAFLQEVPDFRDQSLKRKPAGALVKAGTVALDCRYLNFSPQCAGWHQLTERGGSGSFVIFFSGLWKLTTAATIPYYTGQYGDSARGFGFVTIGANVDDFHKAATDSARQIGLTISEKNRAFQGERAALMVAIEDNLHGTAKALTVSTLAMVVIVIAIAIWMAAFLTTRITDMIHGIERFRHGDLSHRLKVRSHDEMGRLAQAFNSMADSVQESLVRSDSARVKAEEANQIKTDFIANVSHELRTPLNGILGFADLLGMELTDEAQRDYASTIKRSGQHLMDIVNDLLDLAKVEAGRLELRPEGLDTRPFVLEVVGLHRAHAQSKGLALNFEVMDEAPVSFVADALRLRQILNNLLNNAVKYTDTGHVTLRVGGTPDELVFAVEDSGRGIAPEMHELVFEKFRRADPSLTRRQDGTGLGLALAKQLASLMGGRIELRSALGEGSTFTLHLPVTRPA
ncbi:sensor histidine kinase [Uliginosibacterium sp. H1]|uniref:sensor histidine kinase n=1 Tax=Uliginosibacterium sp. H1 TaxID=3114757 RepID=UPI002E19F4AC|nr:ATP-binding protein [Uliginosibacterium sp. H1]